MAAKKTVSLFLYLPDTEEVILSRRAKTLKRPGLLQATVHGMVEEGEDDIKAISRELKEETNLDFGQINNLRFIKTVEVGQTIPEVCDYYSANINPSAFSELKKTAEVEDYVRVDKDGLKEIVRLSLTETTKVDFYKTKVMYDDELGVLQEIFKKIILTEE